MLGNANRIHNNRQQEIYIVKSSPYFKLQVYLNNRNLLFEHYIRFLSKLLNDHSRYFFKIIFISLHLYRSNVIYNLFILFII